MTTLTNKMTQLQESLADRFNWRLFLADNITGSGYQTAWIIVLTLVTALYTISQLGSRPLITTIVLIAWVVGLVMIVYGELFLKHSRMSRWLKDNLMGSVSNALLTLFFAVLIINFIYSVWLWAVVNATFDSTRTAPEFQPDNGATWGVIWGARKLLLTGLLAPALSWRVWLALFFIIGMWVLTYITSRPALQERLKTLRMIINGLWLLSPIVLYIFLAGITKGPLSFSVLLGGTAVVVGLYLLFWWQKVIKFDQKTLIGAVLAWPILYAIWWGIGQTEVFSPINADDWGGLLLTLIIAASVIVLSLPLGMALALGRRSEVYGIPSWIVWPAAIIATAWGFTTTPELFATSRNFVEQVLSFWPILILLVAYGLQSKFAGNMVAAASTTFIELIRSVPLITLLFMGIVMAPFFFETGTSIAKPWPVIVGYTLFSSAYMAETIRGGLQAIPKGQYEAADSLGFNTLQKMRFIILPQALRIVIPAIVGQFIGAFKSSSLVSIVGLFDLLGIQKAILANAQWQGLRIELYVTLALVYFIGSYLMSSYSRRLEVQLSVGQR